MNKYIFLFLFSQVYGSPTNEPTSQPIQRAPPGALCSDLMQCEDGYCVGPFKLIGGLEVGVCAPYEVGRGCLRACLESCRYFPGNCLTCKEGKKLKEGRCL